MGSRTMLLVEDNPQDEMLILRALEQAGLAGRVVVVRDGQAALDYIFRQGEFTGLRASSLPTVVVLDINLPRVGGLDVLGQLRANTRTHLLPVVVLTSSGAERDRMGGYLQGANSFVYKSSDPVKFAETVARMGIYWLEENEPLSA